MAILEQTLVSGRGISSSLDWERYKWSEDLAWALKSLLSSSRDEGVVGIACHLSGEGTLDSLAFCSGEKVVIIHGISDRTKDVIKRTTWNYDALKYLLEADEVVLSDLVWLA